MSNHLHLIVRTRPDIAAAWSDEVVVMRWLKIAQLKRGRRDEPTEPTEARLRHEIGRKGRGARLRRLRWFRGVRATAETFLG